jgi:8-oxo-dGTP pyrophosphatase MutT (NUDIX family)
MTIIAGCIIRNQNGEYLMVQEKQERVRGLWNIPAGYADEGESPQQAAVRETREEVGLIVAVESEPAYVYEDEAKGKQYCAFRAKVVEGELAIQSSELLNAQWLPFEAIKRFNESVIIRDPWIFAAIQKVEHENSRN